MPEPRDMGFWVIDVAVSSATLERLADARELADAAGDTVAVLLIGEASDETARLIAHGADHVVVAAPSREGVRPEGATSHLGQDTVVAAASEVLPAYRPRVVFASGDPFGRAVACRLAARLRWRLASPALMVRRGGDDQLVVSALDGTGRRARQISVGRDETVVVTLRPGVAEALPPDPSRRGTVTTVAVSLQREAVQSRRFLPADPATSDIRHVERLVAGGRGVGGPEGFEHLRRIAAKLGAGVAASRVAVDAGWIEYARQVGQTGKTVKPKLYIACGISGASHHWEGMSESEHVIAINSDAAAPIHQKAHLGLVADLHQVLHSVEERL